MSLIHQIALTLIPSVGPVNARKLLQYFGDARAVFQAGVSTLISETGMSAAMAARICSPLPLELAEKQYTLLNKHGCQLLFYTDPHYPFRLQDCHDAPVLLYGKGQVVLNHPRTISIVGTRKPSAYGLASVTAIIETLQDYDVLVVSGLAYGIDIHVHRECLRLGVPTVAVLGHGLERVYPVVHQQTAAAMLDCGGLFTEFPFQAPCRRDNFPKRNRIIAGMADVTLVVEAAAKGGALITAELANTYHREVYALPGRVSDPVSAGCNYLIRTHQACLMQQPAELMEAMGWNRLSSKSQRQSPAAHQEPHPAIAFLNPLQRQVYQCIAKSPCQADSIKELLQLPAGTLALTLLDLEMKGLIVLKPGGVYLCANG